MSALLTYLLDNGVAITGSRKFNSPLIEINETTDWDFVVGEGSAEYDAICKFLEANSIATRASTSYIGPNTQSTTHVIVVDTKPAAINIIVKSKATFTKYLVAFNRLTPEVYRKYIWKSSPDWDESVSMDERKKLITDRIELLVAIAR